MSRRHRGASRRRSSAPEGHRPPVGRSGVTWAQTTDAAELWHRVGQWLGEHPVENAPLLAEVAHLLATDTAPQGLECGWWSDDSGVVGGAYVRAAQHDPLLTRMPRAALDELVPLDARPDAVGVPGVVADDVVQASAAAGTRLTPTRSFTVHVLEGPSASPSCAGRSRIAEPADEPRLHRWFDELMAGLPGDPSDRAYVIDDPLAAGGLVLWEVDGDPVAKSAMASVLPDAVQDGCVLRARRRGCVRGGRVRRSSGRGSPPRAPRDGPTATGDEQEEARLAARWVHRGGNAGAAHGARRELTGPRRRNAAQATGDGAGPERRCPGRRGLHPRHRLGQDEDRVRPRRPSQLAARPGVSSSGTA